MNKNGGGFEGKYVSGFKSQPNLKKGRILNTLFLLTKFIGFFRSREKSGIKSENFFKALRAGIVGGNAL